MCFEKSQISSRAVFQQAASLADVYQCPKDSLQGFMTFMRFIFRSDKKQGSGLCACWRVRQR